VPFAPGVAFDRDSGKLYHVADGHVTVFFPWPEMRAFRRPLTESAWRSCDPAFLLPFGPHLDGDHPLDRYCSAIPHEVQETVRPFAPHHWRLLALIARSGPGAMDISTTNPALALMLASAPEFGDGARRSRGVPAPVLLVYRRQREILGWLGFPATEAARRIVRKITHGALDVERLRALRARFRIPEIVQRLAHAPCINAPLLRMAVDGTLIHLSPRLIARVAGAPDAQPLVEPGALSDTLRMCRTLRPAAPLPSFDTASRLAAVHDELADAISREGGRGPDGRPDPEWAVPFPGTDTIIPLESAAMLRHESRTQRNCVASYAGRIAKGRYAAYRVLAPERCTLGLLRRRGQWDIDQLKGFANATVGFETVASVRDWLHRARRAEQADARQADTTPPARPATTHADRALLWS
jgi:hypothetical protein